MQKCVKPPRFQGAEPQAGGRRSGRGPARRGPPNRHGGGRAPQLRGRCGARSPQPARLLRGAVGEPTRATQQHRHRSPSARHPGISSGKKGVYLGLGRPWISAEERRARERGGGSGSRAAAGEGGTRFIRSGGQLQATGAGNPRRVNRDTWVPARGSREPGRARASDGRRYPKAHTSPAAPAQPLGKPHGDIQ